MIGKTDQRIEELKKKYSSELKDVDNPIKICLTSIFEAATQRDPNRRNEISKSLSEHLIQPDGLINLFLAVIDFDASSQHVTTHNQRFLAVAKIVTCLPTICVPFMDYSRNISKQLMPLLVHPMTQYSSLATIIINALIDSPHASKLKRDHPDNPISDIVLNPILSPLTSNQPNHGNLDISNAIIAIHNLIQNHFPVKLLLNSFSKLLHSLVTLHGTSSHLKSYIKHCLIEMLNSLEPGPACCLLEQIVMDDEPNTYQVTYKNDEISVEISAPRELDEESVNDILIDLLDSCKNDSLSLEFFFHFQSRMWSSTSPETGRRCAALIEPLLTRTLDEDAADKPDLLTTIATNRQRSYQLITRTMTNYLEFLQSGQLDNDRHDATLITCINILEVIMSDRPPSELKTIIPVINEMKTHLDVIKDKDLLQNIDSFLKRFNVNQESSSSNERLIQKEHDSIMKDLNDELVPVRVHALIRMKQLVIANDPATVAKIPQLYSLVESSLADEESYVFLASINLLAEMGFRQTREILPKLINLLNKQDLSIQQRMNVGEVLARLTRRLNKTTPHYAKQVIYSLIKNSDNQEELMRMSCLTNIGIISSNLGDSLGRYILDILLCIERVLNVDNIQVKCAAVDLLRTTLMGLDKSNVESVQRELSSIYKLLKKLKYGVLDDKLCMQVALALDEIDRLAKEMLGLDVDTQKRRELVKSIKVIPD